MGVGSARVPYDLIAVGDVMLDGTLPAPLVGGRVHGRIELRAGGSAVTAARAAARLGARAAVVGRVGADAAGRLIAEEVEAAGVASLLAIDEELSTGCVIVVGGSSIVADPGASAHLAPGDLPATLEAHSVLVSGYSLLHSGSEAAARAAVELAQTDLLAIDAASARLVTEFGPERFLAATANADILLANADEARALTGLEPAEAALRLAERYRIVCVKLGSAGALAASGGEVVRASVRPIDREDTFGVGDAFAGGFLLSLSQTKAVAVALRVGCDAAGTRLLDADGETRRLRHTGRVSEP